MFVEFHNRGQENEEVLLVVIADVSQDLVMDGLYTLGHFLEIFLTAALNVSIYRFEDYASHATCQYIDEREQFQEDLSLGKQIWEVSCDALDNIHEYVVSVLCLVLKK